MKQSDKIKLYEGYLHLDDVDLDEALIQQPQCFYEVCKLLADAKHAKSDHEVALKRLEGRISKAMRKKYESRDNYATDSCIASLVDQTSEVSDSRKLYNQLCVKVNKLDGLKEAYRQRSFSLNALGGRRPEAEFMPGSIPTRTKRIQQKARRTKITRSL